MFKVGLTGGIGSGKSTVARIFQVLGVSVYCADSEAKRLMNEAPLHQQIVSFFGEEVYENKIVNTKKLAAIVFSDEEALKRLNSLVHPAVQVDFSRWAEQQPPPYVVEESAILFEHGLDKNFDFVISVLCPMQERLQRIQKRDNVSTKQIHARMSFQVDDTVRGEKSDALLQNGQDDLLLPQLMKIDQEIRNEIVKRKIC